MSIMLCPDAEELKRFSLGQLPEPASDQLATHLSNCASCQSELETVVDDSLVADLRSGDPQSNWEDEPACESGMLRSLGALSQLQADNSDGDIPKRIGEYEIIRMLGRGGMGTVYLAHHTRLGRDVALKVLADHRLADSRARQRFESEMQAIGRLSHPGIVAAFDARDIENAAVIVTEFIDGVDLEELVRRVGPLSIADATEIVRRVAETLQYTCDAGYVHRDVKPSNIMLSISGEVKLLDLGLARPEIGPGQMTGTGQAMGTADYIAPEQVTDGKNVDIRADIYSLGCTLFKLLTGEVVFGGDGHTTAFAKMTAHVSNQPPKLSSLRSDAPSALEKLLARMLAKSPTDRPASPNDVANSLTPLSKKSNLDALIETAQHADAITSESPQPSAATILAQPKPFFSRSVPTWTLFCTGLAALTIGIVLGVIITIKYPDGTKITLNAPDGSKVSIAEGNNRSPDVTSNHDEAPPSGYSLWDDTPEDYRDELADMPLALVVLVDAPDVPVEPRPSKQARLQAFEALQRAYKANGALPSRTIFGTYIPLYSGVEVDRGAMAGMDDTTFILAETDKNARIVWENLKGHISASDNGRGELTLKFDEDLSNKLSVFLEKFVHRQLAIVSFGRVAAVKKILSPQLDQVAIRVNPFSSGHRDVFDNDRAFSLLEYIGDQAKAPRNLRPTGSQLPTALANAKLAVCVIANEGDIKDRRGPAFQSFLRSVPADVTDYIPHTTEIGLYLQYLSSGQIDQAIATFRGRKWAVVESAPSSTFPFDIGTRAIANLNGNSLRFTVDPVVQEKLDFFASEIVGRQVALVSRGRILSTHNVTSATALQGLAIETSALSKQDLAELMELLGSNAKSTSVGNPTLQGVWELRSKIGGGGKRPVYPVIASFVRDTYAITATSDLVESGTFDYDEKTPPVALHKLGEGGSSLAEIKLIDASTMEFHTFERGQPTVQTFHRVDVSIDDLHSLDLGKLDTPGRVQALAVTAATRASGWLQENSLQKAKYRDVRATRDTTPATSSEPIGDTNTLLANESENLEYRPEGNHTLPVRTKDSAALRTECLARTPLGIVLIAEGGESVERRGIAFQSLLKALPQDRENVQPFATDIGIYVPLLNGVECQAEIAHVGDLRFAVVDSKSNTQYFKNFGSHVDVSHQGTAITLEFDDQMKHQLQHFLERHAGRKMAMISRGQIIAVHDVTSPALIPKFNIQEGTKSERAALHAQLQVLDPGRTLHGVWMLESRIDESGKENKPPVEMLASFIGNTYAMIAAEDIIDSGVLSFDSDSPEQIRLTKLGADKALSANIKRITPGQVEISMIERGKPTLLKFRRIAVYVGDLPLVDLSGLDDRGKVVELAIRAIGRAKTDLVEGLDLFPRR